MDWLQDAVFRKVHGFLGLARFENAFIAVPPPVQYLKHEEKTKKIYQTDKFIVVETDVEVGEALGTRLTAGANWTRARSDSPDLQPHLITTRATQAEARDWRGFKRRSEEPEDNLAAKRRRLEVPQFPAQSIEHDDEPEMSGSRPGKRLCEHQLKTSIQITEANEAYSSRGGDKKAKEEIADSANEEATDLEEVLSAKRVPRNLVKYGWVSGDNINVADILGVDPHAISNDLAIANEMRDKSWAFFVDRYHRSKLPESNPAKHVPNWNAISGAIESQRTMRRNIGGGPQPMNRLGSKPPFSESQHKKKVFDLTTGGGSENGEQHPSKRRRMEPEPLKAGSDLMTTHHQEELGAEKTGSLRGYAMHKSASTLGENTGVEEYKGVEVRVQTKRSRNRNSESFENETTNGYGSGQVKRSSAQQSTKHIKKYLSTEDPQDPIVDDSDDPLKQKFMAASKKKAMADSESRDSRNHKGTSGVSESKGHGARESPYFHLSQSSRQNGGSSAPRSNGANSSRASDNQNRVAHTNYLKTILIDVDNESTDDLSADHYGKAQSLLRAGDSKRIAKPSSKAKGQRAIDLEDSSSDEEPERGDIQPTTFTTSQKSNSTRSIEFDFPVRQAVSDAFKWKPSDKKIWKIRHNTALKTLRLIDDNHKEIPSFSLSTGTILHIEVAESGSIIGLLKSRDINPSNKIYLQLGDINELEKLIRSLTTHNSTIQIFRRPGGFLQKCLINYLEKELVPPKSQGNKLSLAEEKELGQLMKNRQNPEKTRLVGQKAHLSPAEDPEISLLNERACKKTRGQSDGAQLRDGNQQNDQDSNKPTKSQGMSKAMRLRSTFIEDDTKNGRGVSEVAPKSFYGGNDRGRASSEPSHETSTPTRRQKRVREPSFSPERWSEQNPDWASLWKASLIYPKEPGKRNKTTVDEQDIERLDEGQFLNDNIINFYLSWLEEHHPELKDRVFFHHSFFYQQLTTSETGKSGFHYSRVERWTSKVDLLKYDYIVVPVNEHYHWYLAIICNAPNLMRGKESGNIDQSDGVVDLEKIGTGGKGFDSPSMEGGNQQGPESTPTDINTKLEKVSLEYKSSKSNSPSSGDGLEHDLPPPSNGIAPPQDNGDLNGPNDLEIDHGPTQIGSDLLPTNTKKSGATKKTGSRTTGTSTYDPTKPRIITLDSLGNSHSPTCTNLKKYLIQEIESKKHQKVDAPQSIGIFAKNIPTQNNSCDCGLYLLGYTEMFLEDPDGFVRRLVQRDPALEMEKIAASKMRADIRNILFKLQSDQIAEAEKMRREKAKSKRAAGLEKVDAATEAAKPSSRVSSRSAPTSPRDNVPELSRMSEKPREPIAVVEAEQDASRNDASTIHKPTSIEDDGSVAMRSKSLDSPKRHGLPKSVKTSKPKLKLANEVIELDDSPQKSNHEMTTSKKKHTEALSTERSLHSAKDIFMPKVRSFHDKSKASKIKSPSPEDYPDHDKEMLSSPNPDITTSEKEKLTSPNGVEYPTKEVKRQNLYEIEDSQTSDPQLLDNDDLQQVGPAFLSSPRSSSTLLGNSRSLPNSPPLNLGGGEFLTTPKGSKRKHNGEDVAKSNKRHQSPSPLLVPSPKNNIKGRDPSDAIFLKQYTKSN